MSLAVVLKDGTKVPIPAELVAKYGLKAGMRTFFTYLLIVEA